MFTKLRIRRHMEVADHSGKHIGTVDSVETERLKLASNKCNGSALHFIGLDLVERISNNCVYLKRSIAIPVGAGS